MEFGFYWQDAHGVCASVTVDDFEVFGPHGQLAALMW